MNEGQELRTQESFEGTVDDAFAHGLEADPAARAEYAEQLRIHLRLGVLLGPESAGFTDSVLRELRYKGDSDRFAKDVVGRIREQGGLRRRWVELVAAALVLAALGFFLLRPPTSTPVAGRADLLFVVGQVPLDAGDLRVKERLERTHRVELRAAGEVRPEDAVGRALVLVSSTAAERLVKSMFRDVDVPVLTWEPRLFHDLGMIPGSVHRQDWGTVADQTRLRTNSGAIVATSRPAPYSWARVRSDAVTLARVENEPEKVAVFRYERGAAMPGLVAPARRVGVFLFDWTALALTDDGWALFDGSVRWCLGD